MMGEVVSPVRLDPSLQVSQEFGSDSGLPLFDTSLSDLRSSRLDPKHIGPSPCEETGERVDTLPLLLHRVKYPTNFPDYSIKYLLPNNRATDLCDSRAIRTIIEILLTRRPPGFLEDLSSHDEGSRLGPTPEVPFRRLDIHLQNRNSVRGYLPSGTATDSGKESQPTTLDSGPFFPGSSPVWRPRSVLTCFLAQSVGTVLEPTKETVVGRKTQRRRTLRPVRPLMTTYRRR